MLTESQKAAIKKVLDMLEAERLGAQREDVRGCAYFDKNPQRNPDTFCCCAVGAMIPPHLREQVWRKGNTMGIHNLLSTWPELREAIPFEPKQLMDLQSLHDEWTIDDSDNGFPQIIRDIYEGKRGMVSHRDFREYP